MQAHHHHLSPGDVVIDRNGHEWTVWHSTRTKAYLIEIVQRIAAFILHTVPNCGSRIQP
jgi:hypothetical protein